MRNSTSTARRATKSYSIDPELHGYVLRTRGRGSASERVNQLLRRAIESEQDAELEAQAARFYAIAGKGERKEARAFYRLTKRSLSRD